MGNPSDTDKLVRTSNIALVDRLRLRVGGMLDREIKRREIIDQALVAFEGLLDIGFVVGDGITEKTYRPHRTQKVTARVGKQVPR